MHNASHQSSVSKHGSTATEQADSHEITIGGHHSSETTPTSRLPVIVTAPPLPSCTLQNDDPDQGINAQGCICGTTTLPLLTIPSATDPAQSCSYKAFPVDSPNPITVETQVWSSNCQACTLAGGIADNATCTSVAGCTPTTPAAPTTTFALQLSNNSVGIGNANNLNNGSTLRTNVYNQLQKLCPDNLNNCTSETSANLVDVATVLGYSEVGWGTVAFTIENSYYDNTTVRDVMLASLVTAWQQAAAGSCKPVPYELERGEAANGVGCGPAIIKRELPTRTEMEKRTPLKGGVQPEETCKYQGILCSGPNEITAQYPGDDDPYRNHLDIEVEWLADSDSSWAEFICETVIDAVAIGTTEFAPELTEMDIFEDIDFQAICVGAMKADGNPPEVNGNPGG
ncbi:MAG: hypothetical protein Q9165_004859 [Trypethelium subeluteriae]